MANKATTHVIRGTLDWAKVLGKPRPHTGDAQYDKGPYWSVDVTPNAEGIETLKSILSKKHFAEKMREPKGKDTRKQDFLSFKHLAFDKDGEPNDPIKITDASGNDWPPTRLIGNGTIADVKFRKVDYGTTVGIYIQAIRILKLVPYEIEEFAPLSEDDEFFGAEEDLSPSAGNDAPASDEDLEDDVPF